MCPKKYVTKLTSMISKYYGTYSATDHTATELQNKKKIDKFRKRNISK